MKTTTRPLQALKAATYASIAALALGASGAQAETLREALVAVYNTNPTLEAARANQRSDERARRRSGRGAPAASCGP